MKKNELILWLVVLLWAGNYTVGKFGVREINPVLFTALRFLMAGPLLLLFLRLREGNVKVAVKDLPYLALIGLVGISVYQTLFIAAVKYTTAANASLALGASPIFTAIISALAGQERLTWRLAGGSAMSFTGLFLVLRYGGGELNFSSATATGDLLALAAAILWGLYPVLVTPLLKKYTSLKITAISAMFGMAFLLVYSLPELAAFNWRSVSMPAWLSLLYSAGPVTVFGLAAWYHGVNKTGSNSVMVYMYSIPAVAILIAALALGERISPAQFLGGLVITAGILTVKKRTQENRVLNN